MHSFVLLCVLRLSGPSDLFVDALGTETLFWNGR